MEKVTIKDVAREAGVSISTVSNALNDVDVLNPETKSHVLKVAKRLNYVPNLNGKLLRNGKTKMLGFFTTSVSGPYFYKLVESMSRECDRLGYGLNVFVTKDKQVIMSNILGRRVDGVIIYEELRIDEEEIAAMVKDKIKAVFLDRPLKNDTMGSVIFDSFEAGFEATKYLISLGHKKIAYISGVDEMYDSVQRREGYLAALRQYQLPTHEEYIIQGYFEEESTYNAIKSFLHYSPDKIPDAFLAGNDLSAIGCIQALKSHGYEVPLDVSVMGFDDIDIAQYFSPPLTTVRNQIARQGILAINHLVRMIQKKEQGEMMKLAGELVVRGSSQVKIGR
ncbi:MULTISPECIES: LacI family DNA-binding transcriptional regulator [Paenibacillus]|jgi:LacI family purine nucleotide synthesis repressor|uniref:LacI family transcriptional regulator n=1 Tax=Paenibacillus odorifer TaxID=189426 RepID=A0A1R0X2K6_9BACL|nr:MULTISPECIES: LacI family DNA-binding transcriptional regulator [Paenibacillus]AIQ73730.1 alanine racemase [Paenibacillus odorifer]AWV33079.1 LacI family transcriptional regulator [Paenibacillus odorifer]ETT45064.1 LacI family transcriptional regulator [Paenibacillus sp. FSL H8-237]MDH6426600.1 LacI family purine nucleotide synthesis repressor [Paenibacillus sp. PastH-4]MDH6442624.1 LacI family purine nucleotide synthesis repressor [Paenibacillus sp. PastF-4]